MSAEPFFDVQVNVDCDLKINHYDVGIELDIGIDIEFDTVEWQKLHSCHAWCDSTVL